MPTFGAELVQGRGQAADFQLLGPNLSVRFETRRLSRPRLLWLNTRWWLAAGFDLFDARVRAEVQQGLIHEFAVSVPTPWDLPEYFEGPAWLDADRYGETGGSIQGGSGRTGHKAFFNAKGIGRTPLVSDDADWYHSHGCLWLEEAVREAVCSEVAAAEFPHGAVPVVALIDAGLRHHHDDGTRAGRRAIVVRPNFVRLAHMFRSVFFGSSGAAGSDQALDALRTRDAVNAIWGAGAARAGLAIASADPAQAAERLGHQIGFSHAARLWPGPYFASNYTVDGAVADFGSFRSLPDWRRAYGSTDHRPFGDELRAVTNAMISLAASLRKHGVDSPDPAVLTRRFQSSVDGTFRSFFQDRLRPIASRSDSGLYRAALDWCTDEFARQQRIRYVVADEPSPPSLYDRVVADTLDNPLARLLVHNVRAETRVVAGNILKRLFDARGGLVRERLVADATALSESRHYDRPDYPAIVATLIETRVAAARRHWPALPERLLPLRHVDGGYCALLDCLDSSTMERRCWAIGTNISDEVAFFGHRLPRTLLPDVAASGDQSIFPLPAHAGRPAGPLELAGRIIHLPGRWTSLC